MEKRQPAELEAQKLRFEEQHVKSRARLKILKDLEDVNVEDMEDAALNMVKSHYIAIKNQMDNNNQNRPQVAEQKDPKVRQIDQI